MATVHKNGQVTVQQAMEKISRYCSFQERSHLEVKNKLYGLGLRTSEVDDIVVRLIAEGYLNEERFARAFAGGKFRMKSWGRIKIARALEAKGLGNNCIKAGLKEIEDEDYLQTLRDVLLKKITQSKEENLFVKRDKIARFAIQKGFEPELVWNELKSLLPG